LDILSRTLPLKVNCQEGFVFHSSYYRFTKNPKSKVITTVHDFIQEYTSPRVFNLNSLMKSRALIHSDEIIAISENTKKDILKFYPRIDESKISVIHYGVSDSFFKGRIQELLVCR
jgi:mannosyltransferase